MFIAIAVSIFAQPLVGEVFPCSPPFQYRKSGV